MLPDKMNWDEIRCLYEKAKVCLHNPEKIKNGRKSPKMAGSICGMLIIMLLVITRMWIIERMQGSWQ